MNPEELVNTVLEPKDLRVGHLYDDWRTDHMLPSVQHITDGFFGKDRTNFNVLRELYAKRKGGRGR